MTGRRIWAAALLSVGLLAASGLFASGLFASDSRQSAEESRAEKNGPANFVARQGGGFVLKGKPFRVAGVNNHYLTYGSEAEVLRVLDDAVAMHANVVRIFVSPIIGSPDGRVPTVFDWKSDHDSSNLGVHGVAMASFDPDKKEMRINEGADGLQKLDFVLAAAARRKLRLIVAFVDFWGYTGGARQFSAWYGDLKEDYRFFAEDPRTKADYKKFVQAIVTRRNSLSGVAYKDDPAIFAWELMNDPDIHPEPLFMAWTSEMARYVKSLDPHHLLASGQGSNDYKMQELQEPEIDFGTWHGYPYWMKIPPEQFGEKITQYCAIGAAFDKPVLLEEFGLARSVAGQADHYRDWLSRIEGDSHCAGWLVWRLVARQDSGQYPEDHDQFDIHNDGSPTWRVLADSARRMTSSKAANRSLGENQLR